MATLISVTQPTNVEAAYEDMFKEITRKLYGEETGNGLHTLGTPVAHVATTGPTAPEGEQRSFTTLMSDRNLAPTIEYEQQHPESSATSNNNNFKPDEHLTTAFGLAALMQNGFASAGNILPKTSNSNATITSSSNSTAAGNSSGNDQQQQQQRWNNSNEEMLTWPTENKLTNFTSTPKSKSRKKQNSNNSGQNLNANNTGQQQQIQKRYGCSHCPYSTDRRDLFTRHENIHKDEKPFQCYACLKQFNRADHVKKHFLRMHRELVYDINKTRRSVNSDQKPTHLFNNRTSPNQHLSTTNFLTTGQRIQQESSSLSITQTIESVATAQVSLNVGNGNGGGLPMQLKQEKLSGDEKSTNKVIREKRFTCCYCPWSGADKWGLKRHLNTHTKPFVCMLCDYKAARSERLATHVLKVHNKKACNKCSFLADSQEEYQTHLNEIHPHDNRPSRNTNSNVLRTIGNTLVNNNQINNFQNQNTSFGIGTSNNGNIYGNNSDLTNNTNHGNLQDLLASQSSMGGWRLSASGSLIPPAHIHEPGGSHANQKRGAERLFQYLEADGSDPEDYARLLKMDAISRNTASVAQDFHNAGGVVSYNNNNNCNNNNNNKNIQNLTTTKNSREAAYLQQNQENHNLVLDYRNNNERKTINNNMNNKGLENCTKISNNSTIINNNHQTEIDHHRKAMSSFLLDQQQLNNKSPPAYLINQLQLTNQNLIDTTTTTTTLPSPSSSSSSILPPTMKGHRLLNNDFNKENTNLIFSKIYHDTDIKFNDQFQNYIKDIINKYYAESTHLHLQQQQQQQQQLLQQQQTLNQKLLAKTETENYIDYLKSKDDITLIMTPSNKKQSTHKYQNDHHNYKMKTTESVSSSSSISFEKRNNRKQAKPKKLLSSSVLGPEMAMAMLREKYLEKLVVERKRNCVICTNKFTKSHMLVFPYHTIRSLLIHRLWKHTEKPQKCQKCYMKFNKSYSLKVHLRTKHKEISNANQ